MLLTVCVADMTEWIVLSRTHPFCLWSSLLLLLVPLKVSALTSCLWYLGEEEEEEEKEEDTSLPLGLCSSFCRLGPCEAAAAAAVGSLERLASWSRAVCSRASTPAILPSTWRKIMETFITSFPLFSISLSYSSRSPFGLGGGGGRRWRTFNIRLRLTGFLYCPSVFNKRQVLAASNCRPLQFFSPGSLTLDAGELAGKNFTSTFSVGFLAVWKTRARGAFWN